MVSMTNAAVAFGHDGLLVRLENERAGREGIGEFFFFDKKGIRKGENEWLSV